MRLLITAGATTVPIDQVRSISNIFKGRTGAAIARLAVAEGHEVTLLTSTPAFAEGVVGLRVVPYKTYADLATLLEQEVTTGNYDVIIHSAAVSDYEVARVCFQDPGGAIVQVASATKISSKHGRLYLELVQTKKLIDQIREPWGFRGLLVKFKLEVGISDAALLEIAKRSLTGSGADLIVANCLEWSDAYAYILDREWAAARVERARLPVELLARVTERLA